jgi:hypothetical protein
MSVSDRVSSLGNWLALAIMIGLVLSTSLVIVWMLVHDRENQSQTATASIAEGPGGPQRALERQSVLADPVPTPADPTPPAAITAMEVRLFHPRTGGFSDNLLDRELRASTWNVVFGGSVGEPATDALVRIGISQSPIGGDIYVEGPVEVTATLGNQVLAKRHVPPGLKLSASGPTWVPLWLSDVTCAGDIKIVARVGRETRTAFVQFQCGE